MGIDSPGTTWDSYRMTLRISSWKEGLQEHLNICLHPSLVECCYLECSLLHASESQANVLAEPTPLKRWHPRRSLLAEKKKWGDTDSRCWESEVSHSLQQTVSPSRGRNQRWAQDDVCELKWPSQFFANSWPVNKSELTDINQLISGYGFSETPIFKLGHIKHH